MSARRRGTIAAGVFAAGTLAIALTAAPASARAHPETPSTGPIVVQAGPSSSTTTAPPTTATAPLTDPFAPVASGPRTAATAHVSIVDFGFSPASITVSAGTTVVWTNTGQSIHSVTSDTGAFDSSPSCPDGPCIDPSGTYSHTFTTAGTFAYHCRVHANMTAVVVVNPAPTTTTTTAVGAPSTTAAPGVSSGNAPPPSSGVASEGGNQLAFTGPASIELGLALGAVFTLAVGFALRPHRRPFPIPVPGDAPRVRRGHRRSGP